MARALLLIALECYVVVFSFQVGQESFELEEMLNSSALKVIAIPCR